MARESDSSRRRWTEEDDRWARISRSRDLGMPPDYDEATGTCAGEDVCDERAWIRRPSPESQTSRPVYPRIFDPARMEFERSRYRFDTAKGAVGSERGYRYDEPRHYRQDEEREQYRGMGRLMHLWEQGPYSGRGPKGYQRTDERIREDVCDVLAQDGWVDASDIEVRVKEGDVTLMGSVPDRSMKRLAEDAAIGIPGVHDVHNQLNITEPAPRQYPGHRTEIRQESPNLRERAANLFGEERHTTSSQQPSAAPSSGPQTMETSDVTAASPARLQFQEGMDVVDMKGNFIGRVKAVREGDFLVDRSMARDLYVPNSTVKSAENQVVLNVDEEQLNSMDLPKPPIFE